MKEATAARLAWLALLLCLAVLLVDQQGSLGFQPGHHGYLTSMGLGMSKTLNRQKAEGAKYFEAYTRDFMRIDALIGSGRRIQAGVDEKEFDQEAVQLRSAFVLTKNRAFDKSPMTPNNEAVYLFGRVGSTP